VLDDCVLLSVLSEHVVPEEVLLSLALVVSLVVLGGIGACGRELCCSTWLTDFRTVTTSAARYQQLSLNPLKLAGQCGKLKCCLNYELDSYLEQIQ
jgi:cell fate regulator YaaT (PSP1 superfamily)